MQIPAIILAAGRGTRLGNLTARTPKALLQVGGKTLLQHRIESIRAVLPGCAIHVIAGFMPEAFRPFAAFPDVHVHPFEEAATANNIVSLLLALDAIGTGRGFYLFNSDVISENAILEALRNNPAADALVVDPSSRDAEAMKVSATPDGRLDAIAKTLDPATSLGEYIGIARFSPDGAAQLHEILHAIVRLENRTSDWYEAAIDRLFSLRPVRVSLIPEASRWIEIDTPEDLARAKKLFPG
ncbi:MAG: NTP transferase domain-containing protein [Kiritimatiellia bacterium]